MTNGAPLLEVSYRERVTCGIPNAERELTRRLAAILLQWCARGMSPSPTTPATTHYVKIEGASRESKRKLRLAFV